MRKRVGCRKTDYSVLTKCIDDLYGSVFHDKSVLMKILVEGNQFPFGVKKVIDGLVDVVYMRHVQIELLISFYESIGVNGSDVIIEEFADYDINISVGAFDLCLKSVRDKKNAAGSRW
jgi:hypothetical protein